MHAEPNRQRKKWSRRQAKIKIDINHSSASATAYLLGNKVHLENVPWIAQVTLVVEL